MLVFGTRKKRRLETITFNSDASLLVAGGDGDPVVVWNVATQRELWRVARTIPNPTQSLAFHPRAPWLYVANPFGLAAFNTTTGATLELWATDQYARNVALNAAGTRLLGARFKLQTNSSDMRRLVCLDVTDADNPVTKWERPDVDPPNEGWANRVAFFPDGDRFASAEAYNFRMQSDGPRITIRATDTGQVLGVMNGPGTDTEELTISPTSQLIATRVERRLFLFDLSSRKVNPIVLVNDGRPHFTGIAFHPSGRYLATTSNDATVKLYDTTSWQVAKTFTWDIGRMRSIAFSPDGTLAAAGSDTGKVVVWDVDV